VTGSAKKPHKPLFVDSAFASIPEATEIEGDEGWDEWTRALQDQEAQDSGPAPGAAQPHDPEHPDAYAPTEPAGLEPAPADTPHRKP